jgi:hypothetical protein
MALLGLVGQTYRMLAPSADKPRDVLPARDVRILLPEREPRKGGALKKVAMRYGPEAQFGLGLGGVLGTYGLYKAIEQAMETRDRKRLLQKAEYLRQISDPARIGLPAEEAVEEGELPQLKAASRKAVDEFLGDLIMTKLAQDEEEPGYWEAFQENTRPALELFTRYMQNFNPIMGALTGTAGLAAYLATRRQLLPPANLRDPLDLRDATLAPQYLPDENLESS